MVDTTNISNNLVPTPAKAQSQETNTHPPTTTAPLLSAPLELQSRALLLEQVKSMQERSVGKASSLLLESFEFLQPSNSGLAKRNEIPTLSIDAPRYRPSGELAAELREPQDLLAAQLLDQIYDDDPELSYRARTKLDAMRDEVIPLLLRALQELPNDQPNLKLKNEIVDLLEYSDDSSVPEQFSDLLASPSTSFELKKKIAETLPNVSSFENPSSGARALATLVYERKIQDLSVRKSALSELNSEIFEVREMAQTIAADPSRTFEERLSAVNSLAQCSQNGFEVDRPLLGKIASQLVVQAQTMNSAELEARSYLAPAILGDKGAYAELKKHLFSGYSADFSKSTMRDLCQVTLSLAKKYGEVPEVTKNIVMLMRAKDTPVEQKLEIRTVLGGSPSSGAYATELLVNENSTREERSLALTVIDLVARYHLVSLEPPDPELSTRILQNELNESKHNMNLPRSPDRSEQYSNLRTAIQLAARSPSRQSTDLLKQIALSEDSECSMDAIEALTLQSGPGAPTAERKEIGEFLLSIVENTKLHFSQRRAAVAALGDMKYFEASDKLFSMGRKLGYDSPMVETYAITLAELAHEPATKLLCKVVADESLGLYTRTRALAGLIEIHKNPSSTEAAQYVEKALAYAQQLPFKEFQFYTQLHKARAGDTEALNRFSRFLKSPELSEKTAQEILSIGSADAAKILVNHLSNMEHNGVRSTLDRLLLNRENRQKFVAAVDLLAARNKEPWHKQLAETLHSTPFKHLGRFTPEDLIECTRNRLEGPALAPHQDKVAVVLTAKDDHNGAITQSSIAVRQLIDQGYRVMVYEVSRDFTNDPELRGTDWRAHPDTIEQAILDATTLKANEEIQKADFLFINGHGSKFQISLDAPDPRLYVVESDMGTFSVEDCRILAPLLHDRFSAQASAVIDSCSTAEDRGPDNFESAFAEAFPGEITIAPVEPVRFKGLAFDNRKVVGATFSGPANEIRRGLQAPEQHAFAE